MFAIFSKDIIVQEKEKINKQNKKVGLATLLLRVH